VGFNGLRAQEQRFGDLTVCEAVYNQTGDFEFSSREGAHPSATPVASPRASMNRFSQLPHLGLGLIAVPNSTQGLEKVNRMFHMPDSLVSLAGRSQGLSQEHQGESEVGRRDESLSVTQRRPCRDNSVIRSPVGHGYCSPCSVGHEPWEGQPEFGRTFSSTSGGLECLLLATESEAAAGQ
jgi:hypothetical protein